MFFLDNSEQLSACYNSLCMWSDNESDVDLLRFTYLARAVMRIIRAPGLLPTSIGIFGDWGSGKSTVLKMVQKELKPEKSVLVITFNGWLFEGYEDAKTALMGSILDAIKARIEEDKSLTAKAGERLAKLMRRVNFLQVAGAAVRYLGPLALGLPHLTIASVGHDVVKFVSEKSGDFDPEEMKKLFREAPESGEAIRRDVREFREEFSLLLDEAEVGTLVVFIDDLDRCLPPTVIATLEAIKLFLFVPKTAFVIGADERLVQYAVRERFPELPGPEAEVGRDYLEKLVQFPVRIPPLNAAEITSYMGLLFAQRFATKPDDFAKITAHVASTATRVAAPAFDLETCRLLFPNSGWVTKDFEAELDLVAQIAPVLTPGLSGSPRRTKRFLNTLLLRLSMGEDRGLALNRRVLAKLMLLEYLKPEFFRQLARLQAADQGRPRDLALAEKAVSGEVTPAVTPSPTTGVKRPPTATKALSNPAFPDQAQPWLTDEWMRRWLVAEPQLADVDLGPYFYIAHDRVGATDGGETRLSPSARAVLQRLVAPGEATKALGLKDAENLGPADITAVFEALTGRVRTADVDDARKQVTTILKLTEVRDDLLPQLVAMLGTLPDGKISAAVPMTLATLVREKSTRLLVRPLFQRWSSSSTRALAEAARAADERLQ
jgi:hypothetical protein